MSGISADDWMGMYGVASRRADAAEAEVKRLREASRWIPVTEKLPDHQDPVIVFNRDGVNICFLVRSYWMHANDGLFVHDVTHWRPLPEGPK